MSSAATGWHSQIWAIPGFPGATSVRPTSGLSTLILAKVCSRPPEPTMRVLRGDWSDIPLGFRKREKGDGNEKMVPGLRFGN